MPSRYRQDMQRAWERIAAIPTGKLEIHLGTVEYAKGGAGLPILVAHGVLGCQPTASTAGGPPCWARDTG